MDLEFIKAQHGLIPLTDEAIEWFDKRGAGEIIKANVSSMRNGKFFRKWWVLVRYAFDAWSDQPLASLAEYRGEGCVADMEEFRKEVTILAGHYEKTFSVGRGGEIEVKLRAKSISWAQMDEESFERFFSKTIDAILKHILCHRRNITEESLREYVENVLRFA